MIETSARLLQERDRLDGGRLRHGVKDNLKDNLHLSPRPADPTRPRGEASSRAGDRDSYSRAGDRDTYSRAGDRDSSSRGGGDSLGRGSDSLERRGESSNRGGHINNVYSDRSRPDGGEVSDKSNNGDKYNSKPGPGSERDIRERRHYDDSLKESGRGVPSYLDRYQSRDASAESRDKYRHARDPQESRDGRDGERDKERAASSGAFNSKGKNFYSFL